MEHQSYYTVPDGGQNDFGTSDRSLWVNCTGLSKRDNSYLTNIPRERQDYYLQYCISGSISVFENGQSHHIAPGQILILSPKTPYISRNATDEICYYWIHFTGSEVPDLLKRFGLECNMVQTVGSDGRIPVLFRALFRGYPWRDNFFEDSCQACLVNILTQLGRMRNRSAHNNDPTVETIFRSLSYFHNHINSPVTVVELAKIEHFSLSRSRAVFRQCMGMPPSEYMTRMQMRRACELLAMADMSVKEVAEACGYPDQLYFSRVFRSRFGISPSNYLGLETDADKNKKKIVKKRGEHRKALPSFYYDRSVVICSDRSRSFRSSF